MAPAFLVGLELEAGILRKAAPGVLVAVACQGDAAISGERLEEVIARGADAVVSFGLAGALDATLEPGDIVLPEAVIDQATGAVTATDARWRKSLEGSSGLLVTVTAPVTSAAEKASLFKATGAVAVDMESALAGRVAARRRLPFLVVRAIADDAGQGLPPAALAGVDRWGRVQPWAVAAALLRRPGDIPALMRLGRGTGLARLALARVAPRLVAGG